MIAKLSGIALFILLVIFYRYLYYDALSLGASRTVAFLHIMLCILLPPIGFLVYFLFLRRFLLRRL